MVGYRESKLFLTDTDATVAFNRLRPQYDKTDMFLVLFDVSRPDTLQHVKDKWVPEIIHHARSKLFLLVASKCDLRGDPSIMNELRNSGRHPVTTEEGQAVADEIGAIKYREISSKENEGLGDLWETAATHVLCRRHPPQPIGEARINPREVPCSIL